MKRLGLALAVLLLGPLASGGPARAMGADARPNVPGEVKMADDADVQEAEEAVKAAEQELRDYLGGTVTGGIVLDEERGRRLRELRGNVEAAKKRLNDAKSQ